MSEWLDVPVAEVAVGDEARINGYGRREVTGELVDVGGALWRTVGYVDGSEIGTSAVDYDARFRRSSIVAVRRRRPARSLRCREAGMEGEQMSDHPLSAELRGDRVVIEIGIDNLVSAFLRGPEGQRICQKDTGEYDNSRCVVTDDALFAREFVRVLNAEEEDGSTAVTRLFDKSFEALMDDGPMSVWWWELGIPCPGGFRASDDDRSIIRVPAPTKKPKAKAKKGTR